MRLANLFEQIGVKSDDIVMIHGDESFFSRENLGFSFNEYVENITNYFKSGGTVLIPSFTYSFTRGECYSALNSPGKVGKFSECFSQNKQYSRTNHPIFSFRVFGQFKDKFMTCTLEDCFGKDTVFDLFKKMNGKFIFAGCNINQLTYAHHVEQEFQVPYRFLKTFYGNLCDESSTKRFCTYYVRDLNCGYSTKLNLKNLELVLKQHSLLNEVLFGRLPLFSFTSMDFTTQALNLLKSNPFILIN
jgi:aminoglycoside 3-N-acetyltransferase